MNNDNRIGRIYIDPSNKLVRLSNTTISRFALTRIMTCQKPACQFQIEYTKEEARVCLF